MIEAEKQALARAVAEDLREANEILTRPNEPPVCAECKRPFFVGFVYSALCRECKEVSNKLDKTQ